MVTNFYVISRSPKRSKLSKQNSIECSKRIGNNYPECDQKSFTVSSNNNSKKSQHSDLESAGISVINTEVPIILIDDQDDFTATHNLPLCVTAQRHILHKEKFDSHNDPLLEDPCTSNYEVNNGSTSSYFSSKNYNKCDVISVPSTYVEQTSTPTINQPSDDLEFLSALEKSVCGDGEKLCPSCKGIVDSNYFSDHLKLCFSRFSNVKGTKSSQVLWIINFLLKIILSMLMFCG